MTEKPTNPALDALRRNVSGKVASGEAVPIIEQRSPYDRFTLEIELGGAAMESGPDVARALREVADKIEDGLEARGKIVDLNGNTVGEYGPHSD